MRFEKPRFWWLFETHVASERLPAGAPGRLSADSECLQGAKTSLYSPWLAR